MFDHADRLAASRGKKKGVRGLMRAASSLDPLEAGPVLARDTSTLDRSSAPRLSRAASPMDERETPVRTRSTSPMDEVESAKAEYSPRRRSYGGPIPSSPMQLLPGGDIIMGGPDLMGLRKAINDDLDREDSQRFEAEKRRADVEDRARKMERDDYTFAQAQKDDRWNSQERQWQTEDRATKAKQLEQQQARQTQQDRLDFMTKLPGFAQQAQQMGMPELVQAAAKMNGYDGPIPTQSAFPPPVDPGLLDVKVDELQRLVPPEIRKAHPQEIDDLANQGSQYLMMAAGPHLSVLQNPFATQQQRVAAQNGIAAAKKMWLNNVFTPRMNALGINVTIKAPFDPATDPEVLRHDAKQKINQKYKSNAALEKALIAGVAALAK